jgi:ADP-heptose:LPS heptosyltransferase
MSPVPEPYLPFVPAVGPLGEPFDGVERIAVLRGGGLGDLLFAVPAIESLAAAYPGADITLLGTPLHAALLDGRPGAVTDIEILPYAEGVRPDGPEDPAAIEGFFARMRERRFDLAVQVHGGGRFSNPFLLQLGARHTVGARTPDAAALERNLPYVYYQHEVLRALEVVGLAGAAPVLLEPRIRTTAAEREAAASMLDAGTSGLLVLHPGASDPRRQWPPSNFAQVAARAAGDGLQVLVIGDAGEAALAKEVVELAREAAGPLEERIRSVAGELELGELAGLLAQCTVMLGNDSGPRHLAQAVGAATVGVYWFGNVINAQALGRGRHRLHFGWTANCPTCGVDVTQVGWTAERCEHDDSFVAAVRPEAVYDDVAELAELGGPGCRRTAG